jgi:hypothetical protein
MRKRTLSIVTAIMAAANVITTTAIGGPFYESQTITISGSGPYDGLGYSTAAHNGTVISGAINVQTPDADSGAAFIYRQTPSGDWQQSAKLVPPIEGYNDSFGASVGIEDNRAIVGATWAMVPIIHEETGVPSNYHIAGGVFVFGESANGWQQLAKLTPPDPRIEYFGHTVDISGSTALATGFIRREEPWPGGSSFRMDRLTYVFEADAAGLWSLTMTLQADDSTPENNFGYDVAIEGSTIVASSPAMADDSSQSGAAYVFRRVNGLWTQTSKLTVAEATGFFGQVAIDGGRILVNGTDANGGTACLFEEISPDNWIHTATFPRSLDSIALSGDLAIVGTTGEGTGLEAGSMTVFRRSHDGSWSAIDELQSPQAMYAFGWSVAATNGQVFVGSGLNSPGALHVFSPTPEPSAVGIVATALATLGFSRRSFRPLCKAQSA